MNRIKFFALIMIIGYLFICGNVFATETLLNENACNYELISDSQLDAYIRKHDGFSGSYIFGSQRAGKELLDKNIKTITFLNSDTYSSSKAVDSWDVSEANNGSIMAYIEEAGETPLRRKIV